MGWVSWLTRLFEGTRYRNPYDAACNTFKHTDDVNIRCGYKRETSKPSQVKLGPDQMYGEERGERAGFKERTSYLFACHLTHTRCFLVSIGNYEFLIGMHHAKHSLNVLVNCGVRALSGES